MEEIYSSIEKFLKRVRLRYFNRSLIKNLASAVIGAGTIGIFLELCSRFIPIYEVHIKALQVILFAAMAAFIYTVATLPKLYSIAQKVDGFGFQERITTAVEFKTSDSKFRDMVIKDASKSIKGFDYKNHIKLMPAKRIVAILMEVLLIFSVTLFLPNPLKGKAIALHNIRTYNKAVLKKIDKNEKYINKNKKLKASDKKELLQRLSALRREVKKQHSIKKINKLIKNYSEKLALKKRENLTKDMKVLTDKLKNNEALKNFSNAVKNGDSSDAKKALQKLKQKMKNMNDAQKNKLAKAFSKAAKAMKNKELKKSLSAAASAISSQDYGAASSSMDNLASEVDSALDNDNFDDAIEASMDNLSEEAQLKNGIGTSGNGTSKSGKAVNIGVKGKGSSGAGNGTGDKDGGTNPYNGLKISHKKSSGGAGERKYEKVYDPNSSSLNTDIKKLKGKSGKGGSESYTTEKGNTQAGEVKPYNQVIGKYKKKAIDNLENSDIPAGMKDIVKGYFDSLGN